MKISPVIFREYDIRGVYNTDFDAEFAFHLGRAFVTYVRQRTGSTRPRLTLGHDARLSSPEIATALADGFKASGAHVILMGLITSPISYFSTFTMEGVTGGIMVTGSHNPPDYNGFKVSFNKATIFGDEIKELERIIANGDYSSGDGSEERVDILTPYVERYKKEFGTLPALPVVLDCGNGAAGAIVRRMYEGVGLRPEILFETPDGTFPNHHPDPTVEKNLERLKAEVARCKARVGIGFDGDADRIGLVDHTGRFVLGDEMMALISQDILSRTPGAKIVGDVKCSDRMYDFVRKHGGHPIMWKTGHSLIKEKVKIEKAPFGGELSGHIFFADRNYGYDDALYAGLRVIEILVKSGKTIPELLRDLPPSYCTPEIRIDTTEEKKHQVVTRLKEKFSQPSADYSVNLIDGIRVSFADGWGLARASNTQPVLVLRFESTTQEGLARIQETFESVVNPML
ncbi:MAG: phosphomannomutase/phosphoglucomutase [Bdellovibrionales bacterium]